ncbi:MAG: type II secretion system protein [Desulfobacteraceae bacterium]|jgi:prepilin-type N-terminal cleavage/methylation domain-containing protein|nr:MAG: type II secretion system protein [Desulfobacteraceae bacterium]
MRKETQTYLPRHLCRIQGFTFIELLVTTTLIAALSTIAVPTFKAYRLSAEYTLLNSQIRAVMDAQDLYFLDHNAFFPNSGTINIPAGTAHTIPELGIGFNKGHRHRFIIFGRNIKQRNQDIHQYYVEVRADFDFDGNGLKDRFRYTTLWRNGALVTNRALQSFQ